MKSSNNTSLESRKSNDQEVEYRQTILSQVIEEAHNRKDIINENYLLYKMKLKGIENYTRTRLYNDRLTLDSKNNYIRNFLPNYSKYQDDINKELDSIRDEAIELSKTKWMIKRTITRETKDGTYITESEETGNQKYKSELLKIRAKVAELKQKHSEGQNINISAVIVSRELQNKKDEIEKLKRENVIKIIHDKKKEK